MALSSAHAIILKANILTGPNAAALADFVAGEDWYSIAQWYNLPSGSAVWRPNIPAVELTSGIVGSVFNALSVQKQNGYAVLISGGVIDTTQANIRAWFQDIFGAGATATNLTAIAQTDATRFQMLFATAAQGANVTQVFGHLLTADEVRLAMIAGG